MDGTGPWLVFLSVFLIIIVIDILISIERVKLTRDVLQRSKSPGAVMNECVSDG